MRTGNRWTTFTGTTTAVTDLDQPFDVFHGWGAGQLVAAVLSGDQPVIVGSWQSPIAGNDVAVLHAQSMISTTTGMMPDALVINPTDYEAIRLKKDNDGNFIGGGPFYGVNGGALTLTPRLWGLDTVVTPAVAAGTQPAAAA